MCAESGKWSESCPPPKTNTKSNKYHIVHLMFLIVTLVAFCSFSNFILRLGKATLACIAIFEDDSIQSRWWWCLTSSTFTLIFYHFYTPSQSAGKVLSSYLCYSIYNQERSVRPPVRPYGMFVLCCSLSNVICFFLRSSWFHLVIEILHPCLVSCVGRIFFFVC